MLDGRKTTLVSFLSIPPPSPRDTTLWAARALRADATSLIWNCSSQCRPRTLVSMAVHGLMDEHLVRYILVAFVVIPLVELYLLLWLGSLIGFWPTVAITVVTGVLGGSLAKREGLRVYRQWRDALDEMRAPETGIVEGVLVLLGGALLITPGVLTDITGVLLLLPPTRRPIAARVRRAVDARLATGQLVDPGPIDFHVPDQDPRQTGATPIETEGREVD